METGSGTKVNVTSVTSVTGSDVGEVEWII
jgi:hypothetical protein